MESRPNVGLADGRGIASTLDTLSFRFRAVEFADLCTIIEEIVLRERIIITGQIDRFKPQHRQALAPLLDAGVLVPYGRPHPLAKLPYDENQLRASARVLGMGLSMVSPEDARFEVSRLLGAEQASGGIALPLLRNLQHYGLLQRPRFENHVWDLAGRYRTLSEVAQRYRDHHQRLKQLPTMGIPPLALEVIGRCKSVNDICAETLQMRDDLARLRRLMTELEENLCSDRLSPADAIAIEKLWRERWDREVAATEHMGRMALARTCLPLISHGPKIVAAYTSSDPIPALEVLSDLIQRLPPALGFMQLRPLHRPVSNYMQMTDEDMRRAVATLWREDLIRIDDDMRRLAHTRSTPWRLALASPMPNCA